MKNNEIISVIGLGYVGLPIAVEFSSLYKTIGFDINRDRIGELSDAKDRTGEVSPEDLMKSNVHFTNDVKDLNQATFHIITVPTPIDSAHNPDLSFLIKASETVGAALKKGDMVVYESTVYPGATEEDCVPVLEKVSGLVSGEDFMVGYSPERVNPGDKEHSFTKIKKIVSAQCDKSLQRIASVYESVVEAGIYRASSIKVAEAAKVIENTQRDLNIALVNELAVIFNKMNLDTLDVLEAAGTKWNFLPFKPGLVGGHCIGVDPYYLTHKAEKIGYIPQVILAGRKVNDDMGKFIAQWTLKKMALNGTKILGSRVTILGVTFKENCPDIRNSKVFDMVKEFKEYGVDVQIHDPLASSVEIKEEYGVELTEDKDLKPSEAVVLAVPHNEYKKWSVERYKKLMSQLLFVDVKGMFDRKELERENIFVWRP